MICCKIVSYWRICFYLYYLRIIFKLNFVAQSYYFSFSNVCTFHVPKRKWYSTSHHWINLHHNKTLLKRSRARKQSCLSLVSLEKKLARLKPGKWTRDETSLVVSNLGCNLQYWEKWFLNEGGLILESMFILIPSK